MPFVRFLFNGNNSTFCNWKIMWIMSLWETWKIQIVLDSFFNPRNKKVDSKFSYFWVTYVPHTFTLPSYFDLAFTPRFVFIVLLLICARHFPFSLFPFPSHKNSHFQNDTECKTFLVKFIFICLRTKNHFHINNVALIASFWNRGLGQVRMSEKSLDCEAVSRLSRSE